MDGLTYLTLKNSDAVMRRTLHGSGPQGDPRPPRPPRRARLRRRA